MRFDWETLLHLRDTHFRVPVIGGSYYYGLFGERRRQRGTYRAHPLHATFSNDTRMSCRVFVFAGTLSNVGNCSLAAMWVIGETLQITVVGE